MPFLDRFWWLRLLLGGTLLIAALLFALWYLIAAAPVDLRFGEFGVSNAILAAEITVILVYAAFVFLSRDRRGLVERADWTRWQAIVTPYPLRALYRTFQTQMKAMRLHGNSHFQRQAPFRLCWVALSSSLAMAFFSLFCSRTFNYSYLWMVRSRFTTGKASSPRRGLLRLRPSL